ncbi:kinase-like domain-containing protein [Ampelomyces quisqualis]|uniref:Kinase-like domain-containing protein n=1 Tax=Ampelomyces quisqualis TaxID=50730 RepID=A0A6A5Q8K3_AMPQU|nr:kinase-like domain-containing protein [Ampelomyces quisqualis]
MSMFRRPDEESSSSSEESYEYTENDESSELQQDSVLSRIQTLESADSAQLGGRPVPSRLEMRQNSTQNVRDLMLHALLEEKAIAEAAHRLGKDVSDPEVQRVGGQAYQELARQVANNVDDKYAGDDMRNHRATAQEGISKLTRNNLTRLAAVPEGGPLSQAVMVRPVNGLSVDFAQQPSATLEALSGIHAPVELHLPGYPGLQNDRYAREFSELKIIGKGGYGKVFKAKHKLDGSFYAVKRIPVSPAKIGKIKQEGSDELENMLQEVRSLARFDHTNVVRYHNAWLEFTTAPRGETGASAAGFLRPDRLLENAAAVSDSRPTADGLHTKLEEMSFGDPFEKPEDSYGAGIVFETSDNGIGADASKSEIDNMSYKAQLKKSSRRKTRRDSQASQATIATISSTKSRMSAVEDVDEDEEEEDIELIPRSNMPYTQQPGSEVTESMVTHSDFPGHMVTTRNSGPILTLNVQMSLCDTNLAAFLSDDRSVNGAGPVDRHCFHPCVSLELLWNIISGVEYLHAQGVVHRDLKPANVFLSLSTARHPPYGSVDVSSCKPCPQRDCLHVTPRIGDFGLVAALDLDIGTVSKPVGTEYYRPDASGRVNEKLDVFALGVVAFEMVQKFETRMGRVAALTDLRRGVFPMDFAENLGDIGDNMQYLLGSMVNPDENDRMTCEEVKSGIGRMIHLLRA